MLSIMWIYPKGTEGTSARAYLHTYVDARGSVSALPSGRVPSVGGVRQTIAHGRTWTGPCCTRNDIVRREKTKLNNGPSFQSPILLGVRSGPSLVTPHICIGAREDAKNLQALKELGVTHVLNCAKQLPSSHPKEFVHARLEITGGCARLNTLLRPSRLALVLPKNRCWRRAFCSSINSL